MENQNLFTTKKLEGLAKGNVNFTAKMLQIFAVTSKNQIEKIKKTNDTESISRIAHKMKPSIDFLSTEDMQDLVRDIEHKKFVEKPELLQNFLFKLTMLNRICNQELRLIFENSNNLNPTIAA